MGLAVSWLRRLLGFGRSPAASAVDPASGADAWLGEENDAAAFVCSTCGRTDLPETGGWDPPICQECDAAINFAAIEEVELTRDW